MSHSTQQRKQGKPRSPKRDANRRTPGATGVAPAQSAPAQPAPALSPRAAAFRARRGGTVSPVATFTLSRQQEMAYIRDDLRRLVYVGGGLLILMLVILFILER